MDIKLKLLGVFIVICIVAWFIIAPAALPPYSSLGCYADGTPRALRSRYYSANTIEKCAAKARSLGSKIFGMQYGDECWIDSDPNRDYAMHGKRDCAPRVGFPVGQGGASINNIYKINK
jgi:hypothetical protein